MREFIPLIGLIDENAAQIALPLAMIFFEKALGAVP